MNKGAMSIRVETRCRGEGGVSCSPLTRCFLGLFFFSPLAETGGIEGAGVGLLPPTYLLGSGKKYFS